MDTPADLAFPVAGLDLSLGHSVQRPLTTPCGVNVRAFEPTTRRGRGGTRPGLERYVPDRIPEGDETIQHLGAVVLCTTEALLSADPPPDPDPVTGLPPIDDPSSPGPSGSWGPGVIVIDPNTGLPEINPDTGMPYTGVADGSRNPGGVGGGQTVFTRKVRDRGNAVQPNKNQLTQATAGPEPRRCFQGRLACTIHVSPDPLGFDGTTLLFVGVLCASYNPPTHNGPTTAQVTKLAVAVPLGNTGEELPVGTRLVDCVAIYLAVLVGPGSSATVIQDLYGLPGTSCTGQPCTGAPAPSLPGSSLGAVITPA